MVARNNDISLILAKAKKQGWLPDISSSEVDVLEAEAQILRAGDTYPDNDDLAVGQSTMRRREVIANTVSTSSTSMRITYFTATRTETVTQVQVPTGGTAGSGLTLARVGVYSEASNGDINLIASTANDTTLFAAASTVYTKALQAPVTLIRGQRYAVAVMVSGTTMPTFYGSGSLLNVIGFVTPRLCSYRIGEADLPATVTNANLSNASGSQIYTALVP